MYGHNRKRRYSSLLGKLVAKLALVTVAGVWAGCGPSVAGASDISEVALNGAPERERDARRQNWLHLLRDLKYPEVGPVRYDARGDLVTVLRYEGAATFAGEPLEPLDGERKGFTLVKVQPDGTLSWLRTYLPEGEGSASVTSLDFDADGNILLAGSAHGVWSFFQGGREGGPFIAKLTPAGDPIWGRYIRNEETSWFIFNKIVAGLPGGDFVALVDFFPVQHPSAKEVMLIRYDGQTGEPEWGQRFGPSLRTRDVALDSSNNIYISGMGGSLDFGGGELDRPNICPAGYLASFDENGTHRWSRSMPLTEWTEWGQCRSAEAGSLVVVNGSLLTAWDGTPTLGGGAQPIGTYLAAYDLVTGGEKWWRALAEPGASTAFVEGREHEIVSFAVGGREGAHAVTLTRRNAATGESIAELVYPKQTNGMTTLDARSFDVASDGSMVVTGRLIRGPGEFGMSDPYQDRVYTGFVFQIAP